MKLVPKKSRPIHLTEEMAIGLTVKMFYMEHEVVVLHHRARQTLICYENVDLPSREIRYRCWTNLNCKICENSRSREEIFCTSRKMETFQAVVWKVWMSRI